eukprot:CAMPEP_0177751318 /NCGR_PEP_ID=MMETSP0491_2-20121128/309_1 /TAXON_ID=63592 /ORGANISM="Tetraselmis chuii, Strain PLY429" /LENGTH=140 /DNA_ID=CAMNT_0019266421 /DNA_START=225 /DNA_END=647 /DNA_ORIENTATION=-
MPVICIGPVCVPLNMFLPFLLGILHNYGWFNWIKKEWVTFRFYKRKLMRWWNGAEPPQPATAAPTTAPSSDAGAPVVAGTCTDGAVVCEDSENADEGCVLATESVNGPGASPATDSSPAAGVTELRHRTVGTAKVREVAS